MGHIGPVLVVLCCQSPRSRGHRATFQTVSTLSSRKLRAQKRRGVGERVSGKRGSRKLTCIHSHTYAVPEGMGADAREFPLYSLPCAYRNRTVWSTKPRRLSNSQLRLGRSTSGSGTSGSSTS